MPIASRPWRSLPAFLSTESRLWLFGALAVLMMAAAAYQMLAWRSAYHNEHPPGLAVADGAAGGEIAKVSCRNIATIPQDVLTSWVLGYWTGAIPYALRAHLRFMTPEKAGAAVLYACLATPDATIRAAASQALAEMPGLSAERVALRGRP